MLGSIGPGDDDSVVAVIIAIVQRMSSLGLDVQPIIFAIADIIGSEADFVVDDLVGRN